MRYARYAMARCIYCLKDESSASFTAREHVIPASLGSFQPLTPTLAARDGLICNRCNSEVFSPLETVFTEDTLEGIHGQRLNIQNRNSVTMRGNHFKIEQLGGFGPDFFKQMFFFLKPQDGKIVPVLKNQIKLRRFQGGYRVFLPEALEAIRKDSSAFRRVSADMQKLDRKDMCIFGENREEVDKMIRLLHSFGVPYKEKESMGHMFQPGDKILLDESYTCTINMDLARVLAKIGFNYFAYCALQSSSQHLLYSEYFDTIRKFAHDGSGVKGLKQIIPSISEDCILWEEKESGMRVLAHLINFRAEEGKVIVRMTFFGLPAIYKIVIGTLPYELNDLRFGCAHAFDPFSHRIINMSQTRPVGEPTEEQIKATFGLFKRI